ncbi:MAG: hypothetical protein ACYC1C_22085 [Chloroflexota bacterium]
MVESRLESNEEYFKRRGEERQVQAEEIALVDRQSRERWEIQLNDLIQRFDSDVKGLLTAFAQEAHEITEYVVCGPEKLRHQVNWSIEYTKGEGVPKNTILVVLRYTRDSAGTGECVPEYISLEGLIGLHTIEPPTIEALRKALGDASFRP